MPTIRDDDPRGSKANDAPTGDPHAARREEQSVGDSSDGRRLTVRLDDVLDARLRQASAERGLTDSEMAREALAAFLDAGPTEATEEDVLDVLRRKALVGNVPAARELLRHERWMAEHHHELDDPVAAAFAELDATDPLREIYGHPDDPQNRNRSNLR